MSRAGGIQYLLKHGKAASPVTTRTSQPSLRIKKMASGGVSNLAPTSPYASMSSGQLALLPNNYRDAISRNVAARNLTGADAAAAGSAYFYDPSSQVYTPTQPAVTAQTTAAPVSSTVDKSLKGGENSGNVGLGNTGPAGVNTGNGAVAEKSDAEGDNAGGGTCVDPATLILMADGTQIPAGDLLVGDVLHTMHEETLVYSDYPVIYKEIVNQPKMLVAFTDGSTIKTSESHKFFMQDKTWKQVAAIAAGDVVEGMPLSKVVAAVSSVGEGPVVKLTVDEAHTYISEGLVSHNKLAKGGMVKRFASGGISNLNATSPYDSLTAAQLSLLPNAYRNAIAGHPDTGGAAYFYDPASQRYTPTTGSGASTTGTGGIAALTGSSPYGSMAAGVAAGDYFPIIGKDGSIIGYRHTGEGDGSGKSPDASGWGSMSNADKAAFMDANPGFAKFSDLGLQALQMTTLGQLLSKLNPQAFDDASKINLGINPDTGMNVNIGPGAMGPMGGGGNAVSVGGDPLGAADNGEAAAKANMDNPAVQAAIANTAPAISAEMAAKAAEEGKSLDGGDATAAGEKAAAAATAEAASTADKAEGSSQGNGDGPGSEGGGEGAAARGGLSRNGQFFPHMAGGGLAALARGGAAGNLGTYSDGGQLLRGPGDGVSDSIPATIGGHKPAELADGEFVIPARFVSELGNGSTEAGSRKLYAMMDRIQKARKKTVKGKDAYAKDTKAAKYLPA